MPRHAPALRLEPQTPHTLLPGHPQRPPLVSTTQPKSRGGWRSTTNTHTNARTHARTHTHTRSHAHAHTHARTHAHTCLHAYTHTHTHTHARARVLTWKLAGEPDSGCTFTPHSSGSSLNSSSARFCGARMQAACEHGLQPMTRAAANDTGCSQLHGLQPINDERMEPSAGRGAPLLLRNFHFHAHFQQSGMPGLPGAPSPSSLSMPHSVASGLRRGQWPRAPRTAAPPCRCARCLRSTARWGGPPSTCWSCRSRAPASPAQRVRGGGEGGVVGARRGHGHGRGQGTQGWGRRGPHPVAACALPLAPTALEVKFSDAMSSRPFLCTQR